MKKIAFLFLLLLLCGSVFAQSNIEVTNFTVNPQTVTPGVSVTATITFRITVSPAGSGANPCNGVQEWNSSAITMGQPYTYVQLDGSLFRTNSRDPGHMIHFRPPSPQFWELVGECRSGGGDERFFWTASLAPTEPTWGRPGSLGINMNATATPITFNPNTSAQLPSPTRNRDTTVTRTVTFTVPDNEQWAANGATWYLLVRFGGNAFNATQNPSTWVPAQGSTENRRLTVSSNITVVHNIARSTSRSSNTALLRIVGRSPRLDVFCIEPEVVHGGTHTFEGNTGITVRLQARDPNDANVHDNFIRYTIGSGAPNLVYPSGGIVLSHLNFVDNSNTITIRAFATGGDFEDSEIRSWTFVREQPLANGRDAFFFDDSGDGRIDRVVIRTTMSVENAPTRVDLTSPWNPGQTVQITNGANFSVELFRDSTTIEIRALNNGHIFPDSNTTGFAPNLQLGRLFGAEYRGESARFEIGDSIAPIAVSASFDFGQIDEAHYKQTGAIQRGPDALTVTFSEPTEVTASGSNIFYFYRAGNESAGARRFLLNLEFAERISPTTARFVVLSDESVPRPRFGDSLSVVGGAIRESGNNGVVRVNETRRIPLDVSPPAYLLIFTPIKSFVSQPVGMEVRSGEALPVALADFLVPIAREDMSDLNMRGRIIDPLGNLVVDFNGLETDRNNPRNPGIFAWLNTQSWRVLPPEDVIPAPESTGILLYWNAQNQAGRRVGEGAYLAIFDITGPGGKPHSFTVPIPVGTVGR